jgi:peptidoglycan L-alanyl-D-glutamate endopeptidase CwlK
VASRLISDLKTEVAYKVRAWCVACARRNVDALVYCTLRSPEEQDDLYAQGRTKPGPIVTNARAWQSWHQFGRAIDSVPLRAGKALWEPFATKSDRKAFERSGDLKYLLPEWRVFAEEAELAGLEWAGRWTKFREYVHLQDRGRLTLEQARAAMVRVEES